MNNDKSLLLMVIPAASFMLLALSGCTSAIRTRPVVTPISIPADKFECIKSMPRPSGKPIMESEIARYVTSLEESNADCGLRLEEIQILIKCYNDPKCDGKTLSDYITLVREAKAR